MKKEIVKLLDYLKKKDIDFIDNDNGLENIILKNKTIKLKIAKKLFFRQSGIACIYKDGKEKNSVEIIEVTDDMFYDSYLKQIIDHNFK